MEVLPTIELDHQARLQAGEVGKVGTDRVLAPELVARKSSIAQAIPEGAIGIGGSLSQRAGPDPGSLSGAGKPISGVVSIRRASMPSTLVNITPWTHPSAGEGDDPHPGPLPQAGEGDLGRRSCHVFSPRII